MGVSWMAVLGNALFAAGPGEPGCETVTADVLFQKPGPCLASVSPSPEQRFIAEAAIPCRLRVPPHRVPGCMQAPQGQVPRPGLVRDKRLGENKLDGSPPARELPTLPTPALELTRRPHTASTWR